MSNRPRSSKTRWLAGAALAASLTIGGAGFALASPGEHRNPSFHAHQVSEVQLALGQADSPVGAEFVDHWALDQNGSPTGSLDTTCQLVESSDHGSTAQCVATMVLDKGQLTVQGLVAISQDAPADFDLAITGKHDAKTTLDNIAKFQQDLLTEAGLIQ